MKKIPAAITLAILFVIFYCVAPLIDVSHKAILSMFLVSPFLILFMAYVIFKYGKQSGYTFEDKHFDDLEEH